MVVEGCRRGKLQPRGAEVMAYTCGLPVTAFSASESVYCVVCHVMRVNDFARHATSFASPAPCFIRLNRSQPTLVPTRSTLSLSQSRHPVRIEPQIIAVDDPKDRPQTFGPRSELDGSPFHLARVPRCPSSDRPSVWTSPEFGRIQAIYRIARVPFVFLIISFLLSF